MDGFVTEQQQVETLLRERFPFLSEPDLQAEIIAQATVRDIPEGTVIIDIGSYIHQIPLLVSGTIKVLREDEQGNELLLYYLNASETCAMTLSCCMKTEVSGVRAVAEEDIRILAVPYRMMDIWMHKYQSWKNFVMQTFQLRFEELLRTIDNIAFKKMDERLLQYLLDKAEATHRNDFHITHHEIAQDLNSSREVISRLLKQLERLGRIRLSRNHIELLQDQPV